MRVLVAAVATLVVGCFDPYEPTCEAVRIEGAFFADTVALTSYDPAAQTTLLAWSEARVDEDGVITGGVNFGFLGPDDQLRRGPERYASDSRMATSFGTAGGHLLRLGGNWMVVDPSGAVVDEELYLPNISRFDGAVVGVPGGWLFVAQTWQEGQLYDDVELFRVGLDGSVTELGAIGQSERYSIGAARVGDAVWIAFTTPDEILRALRVDLTGTITGMLDVEDARFGAIAGAGEGGMLFFADGTSVALGAGAPGTPTPHPGLDVGFAAYGFPDRGYLVGSTWLDLDGATLGALVADNLSPDYVATTPDSLLYVWMTALPIPYVLGETTTTLSTFEIPFGAAAPVPQVRLELVARGEELSYPCPSDFPD